MRAELVSLGVGCWSKASCWLFEYSSFVSLVVLRARFVKKQPVQVYQLEMGWSTAYMLTLFRAALAHGLYAHAVSYAAQHKDTFWAEPKNNNPLEKTTGMRETFGGESSDQKAEGAVRPCCHFWENAEPAVFHAV